GIGQTHKGICTIQFFNESVILTAPEAADGIQHDLSQISSAFTEDKGHFLFAKNGHRTETPVELFLLKKEKDGSLLFHNKDKQRPEPLTQDALERFALQPSDRCIQPSKKLDESITSTFSRPTPTSALPWNGKFYQEQQKESLCAVHAANAFFGFPAVKIK